MCDEGMLDYRRIHEDRVKKARIQGKASDLESAVGKAAKALSGVEPDRLAVVLSAGHSNEDNFALLRLARDYLGTGRLYVSGRAPGQADDILRNADKNPNSAGVTALCTSTPPQPFAELIHEIDAGRVTHVLALGSAVADTALVASLSKLRELVVLATHDGPLTVHASVVLPASSWAECDGTFVNAKGMAQQSEKAIAPQGQSQPAWKLVALLGKALGFPIAWTRLAQVRKLMEPEAGATVAVETGARA
jgi:NADH-quinone oxidoreductase subunit G